MIESVRVWWPEVEPLDGWWFRYEATASSYMLTVRPARVFHTYKRAIRYARRAARRQNRREQLRAERRQLIIERELGG